jgi:hypothetical protein
MNPKINFENLDSEKQDRIVFYAKVVYTDLKAQTENWKKYRNNRHVVRGITHGNYDRIHTLSIPTGLVSKSVIEEKKKDSKFIPTKDHCYRPQFMMQMFMDKPDIFLSDFNVFLDYIIIAATTILITPEENEKLKNFTRNKKGQISIKVPTDRIYQEAEIELFDIKGKRKWWETDLQKVNNYLITPKPYLLYEEAFLE